MALTAAGLAKAVLPAKHLTRLKAVRSRNTQIRWLKEHGILDLAKRFSDVNGERVLHGPFAAMQYPLKSILSRHSVPMLVGSYEWELHGVVAGILGRTYHSIIDIGTAEGYYAVGFALKGLSPVLAFEPETRERRLCQEMARLNGVADRIQFHSFCSPEKLQAVTAGKRCMVLSDCEGYETELFDESTVAALKSSDVLIELHGNAYGILRERFEITHTVEIFSAGTASPEDYPELACLGEDALRAVAEYRPPGQQWLFAKPRNN